MDCVGVCPALLVRAYLAFWDGQVMSEITVTEHQHQSALFQWWKVVHHRYRLPEKALYHTPNEGKRSVYAAAKLKAEGMRTGLPDIVLAVPRGGYGALYIELKTQKGRPSQDQLEYIDILCSCGNVAMICRGWETAKAIIEAYLDGENIPQWDAKAGKPM